MLAFYAFSSNMIFSEIIGIFILVTLTTQEDVQMLGAWLPRPQNWCPRHLCLGVFRASHAAPATMFGCRAYK